MVYLLYYRIVYRNIISATTLPIAMKKLFLKLAFVIALIGALPAMPKAQIMSDEALEARTTNFVDVVMTKTAQRLTKFNERMSSINELKPLDPAKLNSEQIGKSLETLEEFITYLNNYPVESKSILKTVDDSIKNLRAVAPKAYRKDYMGPFRKAMVNDLEAFDKYTKELAGLYTTVSEVLTFLRGAEFTMVEGQIQFKNKSAYDRYVELMAGVQTRSESLAKAADESRKATDMANQLLKETYPQ
jgi:hypothetical protein